jgi:hypothetical protein
MPLSTSIKAQELCNRVCGVFPSVTRVALATMSPHQPLPPPPGELDDDNTIIGNVVDFAPPHILVQVAFDGPLFKNTRPRKPPRYTLWQIAKGQDPRWQIVDQRWNPRRILAAVKVRQQRIEASYKQAGKFERRVGCGWGKEASEERQLFKEQFFAELRQENFGTPGSPLTDSDGSHCPWYQYLYAHFDEPYFRNRRGES